MQVASPRARRRALIATIAAIGGSAAAAETARAQFAPTGPDSVLREYSLGLGVAGGLGVFARTRTQQDAPGLHWSVMARALARERPLGGRLELSVNTPVLVGGDHTLEPCSESCGQFRPRRQRVSALIGSVSWGLRADRSGVYAIAGAGGYRTTFGAGTPAETTVGVSYGFGFVYFERRGSNSFFLEARRHHTPSDTAGWFVPLMAGVIF